MRHLTDESLTEQLSRERLLDMEARLGSVRRQAFAVPALALIAAGPCVGFEFLIVLFSALVAFAVPIAGCTAAAALSGGLRSPGQWRRW